MEYRRRGEDGAPIVRRLPESLPLRGAMSDKRDSLLNPVPRHGIRAPRQFRVLFHPAVRILLGKHHHPYQSDVHAARRKDNHVVGLQLPRRPLKDAPLPPPGHEVGRFGLRDLAPAEIRIAAGDYHVLAEMRRPERARSVPALVARYGDGLAPVQTVRRERHECTPARREKHLVASRRIRVSVILVNARDPAAARHDVVRCVRPQTQPGPTRVFPNGFRPLRPRSIARSLDPSVSHRCT